MVGEDGGGHGGGSLVADGDSEALKETEEVAEGEEEGVGGNVVEEAEAQQGDTDGGLTDDEGGESA